MAEGLEHAALERDIAELTEAAKETAQGTITKESLREAVAERVYGKAPEMKAGAPQNQGTNRASGGVSTGPLPAYAEDIPKEARLEAEKLLDLAWHKGLATAIAQVRKANPLTMDLFHDAITERLYSEFKQRGILK